LARRVCPAGLSTIGRLRHTKGPLLHTLQPAAPTLRIPAKEIAHSDLMSIKIEASSRWTVIC